MRMAELRMHPHTLGNFRDRDYKHRRNKNSNWRENRLGMSEEHLALVRKLPCAVCAQSPPSDPHHLMSVGERGLSVRSTDRWAVPLCREHHIAVERVRASGEKQWFMTFNIDVVRLAEGLWSTRLNQEQMHRIMTAHFELAQPERVK